MKVMKIYSLVFGMLFLALMSCSNENKEVSDTQRDVSFSSTLNLVRSSSTRIDAWTGVEKVGVSMYKDADVLVSNRLYHVSSGGQLTAESEGIKYPITGNVFFKAVYPYAEGSDGAMAIDLSTDGDHDLMYAAPTKEYNNASTESVSLNFKHQLSRLSLTTNDKTIKDAVYTIHTIVDATFTIADGTLALGTTKKDLTPSATESTTDLIVLPGETVDYVDVTVGDKTYRWDASTIPFKANSRTKYKLSLSGAIATAELVGTVADWTEAIKREDNTGGGETGGDFDQTDLSSDRPIIDVMSVYNEYVYFPPSYNANKSVTLTDFEPVTDYVKFSSSKKKGTATLTVPEGKTKMRFFVIPWDNESPEVVVGNKGTLKLYKGDDTDENNVCVSANSVKHLGVFKAQQDVNMFICDVTAGESIAISVTDATPDKDARFILFGLQFK